MQEMTPRVRRMLMQDTQKLLATTTTMFVPDSIRDEIRRRYPTIEIRWSPIQRRFKILERFGIGATEGLRHLWDYENSDGTPGPLMLSVVLEWLLEADTRRWPMQDRVKLYIDEHKKETQRRDREQKEFRKAVIMEDYDYIAGIKTFFMDPRSMPVHVTTRTPYQEKAAKALGVM